MFLLHLTKLDVVARVIFMCSRIDYERLLCSLAQSTRTFQDYLDCLPPMEMATSQAVLGNLLGSVFHTRYANP